MENAEIVAAILAAGIVSKRPAPENEIAEAVGVYRAVLEEMAQTDADDAFAGPYP